MKFPPASVNASSTACEAASSLVQPNVLPPRTRGKTSSVLMIKRLVTPGARTRAMHGCDARHPGAIVKAHETGEFSMTPHWLHGAETKLPVEGERPGFDGATGWLNSPPLTPEITRGKV